MNSETNGPGAFLLSMISTIFAWVTLHDVQTVFTLLATLTSIVSGIFAARYYYRKK